MIVSDEDAGSARDPVGFAREIALRQLDVRARSREELRRALARRNVPEEVAAEVLAWLAEVGLVDDAAFAREWVAAGQRRLRSRTVLRNGLREKGVDTEVIAEALADSEGDDRDLALQFARRKAPALRALDRQVAYRRLCGALSRRGFGPGVVASVVAEVLAVGEEWD